MLDLDFDVPHDDLPREPPLSRRKATEQRWQAVMVEVVLCVPEDLKRHTRGTTLPVLSPEARPQIGDVVVLGPSSTWAVSLVVHRWPSPTLHLIEVWLERVMGHQHERLSGFSRTQ